MVDHARIYSIEKLQELKNTLSVFSDTAMAALDETMADMQQATLWLTQDRARYWKNQLRLRREKYEQARLNLKRKQDLEQSPIGGQYSYIDEKKALAQAERQLQKAEQKNERIKTYTAQLETEIFTCRGQMQGLAGFIDSEIPNALARLENMMRSLEQYLIVAPPAAAADPTAGINESQSVSTTTPEGPEAPPADDTGDPLSRFLNLRVLTPSVSQRQQITLDALRQSDLGLVRLDNKDRDLINRLTAVRQPLAPGYKIILADLPAPGGTIYLERIATASPNDSGWFIADADKATHAAYQACTVKDILTLRLDFMDLLKLPAGFLIVLEQGRLIAVFNADDVNCLPED